MNRVRVICWIMLFMSSLCGWSQTITPSDMDGNGVDDDLEINVIQFSGVVITDSLTPVPFVNIVDLTTRRGSVSDIYGFFSFVAKEGDTIRFSAVGFKTFKYAIPKKIDNSWFSMIVGLEKDTILLPNQIILPYGSREQFKEAFLSLELPADETEYALKNLSEAELARQATRTELDGGVTYMMTMQQYQAQLYYVGQLPPQNIFNPIAWYKFIKALKTGAFKNKKKVPPLR